MSHLLRGNLGSLIKMFLWVELAKYQVYYFFCLVPFLVVIKLFCAICICFWKNEDIETWLISFYFSVFILLCVGKMRTRASG